MIIQKGFTLIELMLSLTLGLIISAAAILLFLTGQKSLSMQQGTSDIQDNANFGLNYITKDLRLMNLNSTKSVMDDQTVLGGVVLTSSVNSVNIGTAAAPIKVSNLSSTIVGTTAGLNFLSRSAESSSWSGLSNVKVGGSDQASDQLTIQYMPQYRIENRGTISTYVGGYDCEGNELAFPVAAGRQMVVQRYFLRVDVNKSANEPNQPLALVCDAGTYPETGSPVAITGFGGAGEIIMKRVDHLRILLGVQNDNGRRYMSINDYMTSATPHPRIVSVQFGILARSLQSVNDAKSIKDDQTFVVLDQTVSVKKPTTGAPKYIRQVISQTIALRNAIGERGE
ncbi:PilW family protein [Acinetobacter sp. ANC 3832]|uniref:PilW family protein n=1 Tax=Acinetobacter sp. ANC 3832 TaxID=1977874 RepID=UPI000A3559EB|nr:PilW family protein [Acinetobacter sp. ANC 3832]OTG96326.1 pilus assembly protein PilW [Acinetobacter sp. ANC 3832]